MTIHDHFDGSAHCVECKNFCQLRGDELAITELLRNTLEFFAMNEDGWVAPQIAAPLQKLLGDRWGTFYERARKAVESVRKLRRQNA